MFCQHVLLYAMCMPDAQRCKNVLDCLVLELQMTIGCHVGRGIESGSSEKAASAINY